MRATLGGALLETSRVVPGRCALGGEHTAQAESYGRVGFVRIRGKNCRFYDETARAIVC
jgi:hypothetical protein